MAIVLHEAFVPHAVHFLVHAFDDPLASVQELRPVEPSLPGWLAIQFVRWHFKWLHFVEDENLYFLELVVEVLAQRVER